MKLLFSGLRRALTLIFILGVLAGASYFVYMTTTGIADEVEFRQAQKDRDVFRRQTATFMMPSIEAESQNLVNHKVSGGESPPSPTEEHAPVAETPLPPAPSETALPDETDDASSEQSFVPGQTTGEGRVWSNRSGEAFMLVRAVATATPSYTPEPTQPPTVVAQDSPTAFPTNTLAPTALPTNTLFPSNTPLPTDTATPTNTYTPTPTFTPSNTPTSTPTRPPTLVIEGTYVTPVYTPIAQILPRAELVENDPNIINIALLGSDMASSLARTDVIILLTINKTTGTAAMWHIPRDLLVYIPNNTVNKINLTFQIGQQNGMGGPSLLKEMFIYNFGISIDYYARVSFNDFRAIIDELGGVTVSVDCEITDWRLIDPDNAPPQAFQEADDAWVPYWEQYTLRVGVHKLNSYMALWYARSRVTTSDIDRGRRQMDLLRAMWQQAKVNGIFDQILSLGPRAIEIIDTNMTVPEMIALAPLAVSLDLADIQRFSMRQGTHMESWTTPDDGRFVFVGNWAAIHELARQFVTPSNPNRLARESARIEVHDATLYGLGWGQVATERLAWEGFAPVLTETRAPQQDVTTIIDYTGSEGKGSELSRLQEILRVGDSNIIQRPDPDRLYDYRVVVGRNYNACLRGSSADEVVLPTVPDDIGQ